MTDTLSSVHKGRIAEAAVIAELVEQGYEPYTPTFGNGPFDVLAVAPDCSLVRIETKYCAALGTGGKSWEVNLRQTRANRSVMLVKKFNATNSDVLAVYLAPERAVLFFNAAELHGRSSINVTKQMCLDRESISDVVQCQ